MISIKNLTKSFDGNTVLDDISLEVDSGEFVVIAGGNGSGKSTLLKCAVGLLLPEKGEITVSGIDAKKDWKKLSNKIGVVLSSDRGLYYKLTGMENLYVFGGLYSLKKKNIKKKSEELLKRFDLYDAKDKLVETYSTGMKKKLMIIKALLNDAKILFLDEVFNGLDTKAMREILDYLVSVNKMGVTIVLISHILHDLPDFSRLIFLKNGKITLDSSFKSLEHMKVTKLKYFLDGEIVEEVCEKEVLSKRIEELVSKGVDVDIVTDDIYDISLRYLND